jgi:hypothetical protein
MEFMNEFYKELIENKKNTLIEIIIDKLIKYENKSCIDKIEDSCDFIELLKFEKINRTNGLDETNLDNARQNNYIWSISELGDYIYIGTGRNVPILHLYQITQNIEPSLDWMPNILDNTAEIWRYKKDDSSSWERVYKADANLEIDGFKSMIRYDSFGVKQCLYTVANGENIKILKTTNGVNWFELDCKSLKGNISRSMVIHNDKLYLATIDKSSYDITNLYTTLIYYSIDPELYGWTEVEIGNEKDKNPTGHVYEIQSFNNRLYVATAHDEGIQVWRSNKSEPKKDDWTLILDKGAGDKANQIPLSMGVFNEYLYIGAAMDLGNIASFIIPKGCDVIRIDKDDNWELVVGGEPLVPTTPTVGKRQKSLSGLSSGFDNPLNIYPCQIKEHDGKLLIGTLDHGIAMESVLEICIKNKELLRSLLEKNNVNTTVEEIIEQLKGTVKALDKINYSYGFDLYVSKDGQNFISSVNKGLGNSHNYGSTIFFVGNESKLYIGTANPYEGCEVWRERKLKFFDGLDDDIFDSDFFYN